MRPWCFAADDGAKVVGDAALGDAAIQLLAKPLKSVAVIHALMYHVDLMCGLGVRLPTLQ